jgi:hypothetical protein
MNTRHLGFAFLAIAFACTLGGFANRETEEERALILIDAFGHDPVSRKLFSMEREGRQTRQRWFFVSAGVLILVGSILAVIPPRRA